MDDSELERLLLELESDRTERKSSISNKDRLCEAICAFANDLPDHRAPGVIFIGANDNGGCAGLSVTDDLLLNLASLRSDSNIVPFPSMTVQKKQLNGCEMATVIVQPSDAPPVRHTRDACGFEWGPGVQSRPRRRRRLSERRRARDQPYDLRPVASATVDDLDLDLFVGHTFLQASRPTCLKETSEP